MKVKAQFTFICGKTGKGKESGKEWYAASILVHDPDETFDVYTNKETYDKLKSMFEYQGVFEVGKWGDKMQIRSLAEVE